MGKRGQIKVVLFILCVLTVFADCFIFLLTVLVGEPFFQNSRRKNFQCFSSLHGCPEEGRERDLGGEGIERGMEKVGQKGSGGNVMGGGGSRKEGKGKKEDRGKGEEVGHRKGE